MSFHSTSLKRFSESAAQSRRTADQTKDFLFYTEIVIYNLALFYWFDEMK